MLCKYTNYCHFLDIANIFIKNVLQHIVYIYTFTIYCSILKIYF
uniref:Uncharacterized protein n=1 Tax=Anguilla anguilla TaxID=7936 RepID=A0A0E9RT24_ANGAN